MILAPTGPDPSRDIALARRAATAGVGEIWVGERSTPDAPARIAALAAATRDVGLGLGPLPLDARSADHLDETISTLGLIAAGRVRLAFDLPTTLAPAAAPRWAARLAELAPLARRAHVPVAAVVQDTASALLAAAHVDRLVLRGPDTATVGDLASALRRLDAPPELEVWSDLAAGDAARAVLAAVVAERLAVPGVLGHTMAKRVIRRLGHHGVHGDIEAAYARGDVAGAGALVPDDVVRATTLTPETAHAMFDDYRAAGADRVAVLVHGGTQADRDAALDAILGPAPHDAADTGTEDD